ncbi:hypothetical protein EDD17DRAFT_1522561 [Pisolithus thermaeus]|nr:hypothetical protein EDD17DRAFT_1522534 [Pisolithus thermaeus]KAI6169920.1 hypothetical protein EDD17DRAFT_1522561 [Pisolithus thermaeus]
MLLSTVVSAVTHLCVSTYSPFSYVVVMSLMGVFYYSTEHVCVIRIQCRSSVRTPKPNQYVGACTDRNQSK